VADFVDKVRTLDTVLENIESFSSEVSLINASSKNHKTPDASP